MAGIFLLGAVVFLLGVSGMVAVRLIQTSDDPEISSESTPTGQSTGSSSPTDGRSPEAPEGTSVVVSDVSGNSQGTGTTQPATGGDADGGTGNAMFTDQGRRLMAAMTELGLTVSAFPEDSRGAVRDAVLASVQGAIEQCRLTVRATAAEPVLVVQLGMKEQNLVMTARLMATDGAQSVKVWERSSTICELNAQALNSGILPPSLQRGVTTFFNSLRAEFNDARRQFQ
ncbi:MAG: hypothetical protein R3C49_10635 [Planctomycetaceae bacterium]